MKTNSEIPISLLYLNDELNDYDFVLFHLYESNKKYKAAYKEIREKYPDRLMIFDNSAYEFFVKGETLDLDKYYKAINDLKPDMYILPDVLMDKAKTLKGTKEFLKTYSKKITDSKPLAVAQGKTPKELLKCLDEYEKLGIENVAIPFHNSFFKKYEPNEDILKVFMDYYGSEFKITEDQRYAIGRIIFMTENKEHIRKFKHVHLLGSHCPLEKLFYSDFDTMDTAYPVKLAMEYTVLFRETKKPNILVDDFINIQLGTLQKLLIIDNVLDFKNL